MTWRMACHLYVALTVLLSVATAAQAYLFDGPDAPAESPVLLTLLLAGLALTYMAAAVHAAKRSGRPVL